MLRLSGAQITRITESINRCADLKDENNYFHKLVPEKVLIEDLVEDILKEVLPCINPIPSESQSVRES